MECWLEGPCHVFSIANNSLIKVLLGTAIGAVNSLVLFIHAWFSIRLFRAGMLRGNTRKKNLKKHMYLSVSLQLTR